VGNKVFKYKNQTVGGGSIMARKILYNELKSFMSLFVIGILIISGFVNLGMPNATADGVDAGFSINSQVTVNVTTIAPSIIGAGQTDVGMLNVTLRNLGGVYDTLLWLNVSVLNYTDVDAVTLWNETDNDGGFSTLGDTLIGSALVNADNGDIGYANVTGLSLGMANNTNMSLYVAYNISTTATHGDLINGSILAYNLGMTGAGFGPNSTLLPAYDTEISNINVTVNLNTIAPATVLAGKAFVGMLNITFFNNGGADDTIDWINVTALNYSEIDTVSIWREADSDGVFSIFGDTLIGSSNLQPLSADLGYANITSLALGILRYTTESVYIAFNISATATHDRAINASIQPLNMNLLVAGRKNNAPIYPTFNSMIYNINITTTITTIAPNFIRAGRTNVGMVNITFFNNGGAHETLEWINVTVLNYTDVETVSIWNETDNDSSFTTGGDAFFDFDNVTMLSGDLGFANISGLSVGISRYTYVSIYIVFNISLSALHGNLINSSIMPYQIKMKLAGMKESYALYPDYNTEIDTIPPQIISITTKDNDGDGTVGNATLIFSENILDSTVVISRFEIGGVTCTGFSTGSTADDNKIEISLATGLVGTDVKDVTYTYSSSVCTDHAGNELLTVNSSDITEIDRASPTITSAITDDINGNGYIDRYYLTFSENVTIYSNFYNEINVAGYTVDAINSYQSGSNNATLVLHEGLDFDTGATPDITYPSGLGSVIDMTTTMPIDIASGDLNDDSFTDIAILNAETRSITVFLHNGIDQLGTRMDYPSGISRGNVTIGDVNGDGLNDVLATNYETGELLVFIQNSGTHRLNPYKNYTSGTGALGLAVGDVNSDERNDVVVANFEDDQISVFLQNNTGGLAPPVKYSSGNGPTDVVIADISSVENYGYVLYDVVVTNYLANSITPYRQLTSGSLTILTSIATPKGPTGIAAGDLNGDGWTDVVVACRDSNYTSIFRQYASTWTNSYLSASYRYDYSTDINPTDIVVIDANNDGKNDIIMTNQGNSSVEFLLQYSSGSFSRGWKKSLGGTPYGLDVGDFNMDGLFDLVTTQPSENAFTIITQKPGDAKYNTRRDIYLGSNVRNYQPRYVDVGDINNDGYEDIVVTNYYVCRISVFYGNPAGSYRDKVVYSVYNSAWWYPWDVKIGDLNNDGLNDVAVTLYNTNRLAVFYQNVNGKLNDPVFYITRYNARRLAIGDVNNDGLKDVAVTNYNSAGYISVFTQNGSTGQLNPRIDYYTGINYPHGIAIGEVSGDSRNDVVVTHQYGDATNYHMVRFKQKNDGTLDVAEKFQWDNNRWRYMYDVEIADLNNDGRNDIVAGLYQDYYIGVWYQNVANSFGMATTYYQRRYFYDLEVTDFNNDGAEDIVAVNYNDYQVVLMAQTQSGLQNAGEYPVGSNPWGISVGDCNNDGYVDIVTSNYGGQSITILIQNSQTSGYNLALFSSTRDYPYFMAKGDVNNDGLIDIAVINQNSPYYLSIFYRDSNGLFKPRIDYSLSYYPYSVEIGDVNSDGLADVVVSDNWYSIMVFKQKSDGTLDSNFVRYSCGSYGYDIAIGDLNNDGLNDVAVSSYNRWYFYRQTVSGGLSGYSNYYIAGNDVVGIAIGDINNDTLNDVVMADRDNYYIKYMLQTNTGFTSYYTLTPGNRPIDVAVVDLNNDDLEDIVCTNYYSHTISVFTQRSTGGFYSATNYATNSNPHGLDIADFNHDGLMDVITADYGSDTISIITQNPNGLMNTKISYSVYTDPQYVEAADFDNDTDIDIITNHPGYDFLYSIYPEKSIGNDSIVTNHQLGVNSLQEVSSGEILEQDGAKPIYATAITGNNMYGNSSSYNNIIARFSENLNDSTIDNTDFTISGGVTINSVSEISPSIVLLDTSTLNSFDMPSVSLVGLIYDANGLVVPLTSYTAQDGLRPRATTAITNDSDLNGQIDKYIITFDEDIYGTFNGTGFIIEGYEIDDINSSKTAPYELTIILIEKNSFDTGITPNITYFPGDIQDAYGNYLKDMINLSELDGAPPALADVYIYEVYEDHPNLFSPDNTTLIYNNTQVGLDAVFQLRIEAFDNGRLDYAQGENGFGNTSVIDLSENTGGTTWEYELNYTINQGETHGPTLSVAVFDLDNNNATDNLSLILDIVPPITTMWSQLGERYVAPFTPISLLASDPAGVYRTKYRVDSDPWQNYTGSFTIGSYSKGEHVLQYYSIDMVNNTETVNSLNIYLMEDWTGGIPGFGTYQNMVILGCNLTINGTLIFENG
jgi:hypothetical protein